MLLIFVRNIYAGQLGWLGTLCLLEVMIGQQECGLFLVEVVMQFYLFILAQFYVLSILQQIKE